MGFRPKKREPSSAPKKREPPIDHAHGASRAPVRWADQEGDERWHEGWSEIGPAEAEDEEPLFEPEEELPDPLEAESDDEDEDSEEEGEGLSNGSSADEDVSPEAEGEDSEDEPKRRGRRRSKTIARKQMLRERRRMLAQGAIPEVIDYTRPQMRSECRNGERPCLYVSCRYHLYLDVNPVTGSIKLNFPDKEVWDLEETCALDVAERGGITLEEVGEIMNLTRERIRQVEVSGLEKLKQGSASLETFVDGRELPALTRIPSEDL
jgi:hypothetical protein